MSLLESSPSRVIRMVIGGFMGSGKSTVGALLAARLDVTFMDMDAVLVERWGDIPTQFLDTEEAVFRERERTLVSEICRSDTSVVVATGGGVFADPSLLALLSQSAITVALFASFDVLAGRISGSSHRPLWNERVKSLYESRQTAYAQAHHVINTNGLSAADVVEQIILTVNDEQGIHGTEAP